MPARDDPSVQALLEAAREAVAVERESDLTPSERELLRASHESRTGYPEQLSAKLGRLAPRRLAAKEALRRAVDRFEADS